MRLENAGFGAGPGHAVDGAGGFFLADGDSTSTMNGLHTFGSVGTHTRHDDPHGLGSIRFRDRVHQDIGGRSVQGVFRMSVEANGSTELGNAVDSHVKAGGSDVDHSLLNGVAMRGFAYGNGTEIIQAVSEWRGKPGRHMLHDEHGNRKIARKSGEDFLQGLGTSG